MSLNPYFYWIILLINYKRCKQKANFKGYESQSLFLLDYTSYISKGMNAYKFKKIDVLVSILIFTGLYFL